MRWCILCLMILVVFSINTFAQDETLQTLTEGRTTFEISPAFDADKGKILEAQLGEFEAQFSDLEIGLVVSRWSDEGELLYRLSYNASEPYAVASAFKAFVAYAYFLLTPQTDWNTAPDSDVYNMIVYSNNFSTADVIAEISARLPGDANPIQKLNDFMVTTFGVSEKSGIFTWNFGHTAGSRDRRYAPIPTTVEGFVDVRGRKIPVENRYTAGDLALAMEFIAHIPHDPDATPEMLAAYDATRDLMMIAVPNRTATIDTLMESPYIWRKTGFVDASEIGAEASSEVIVIPAEDGGYFVIALISTGENGDTFSESLAFVLHQIAQFDDALPV